VPDASKFPKVVFLFGAGASADAGVPTMGGFVDGRLRATACDHGMASWLESLLTDIAHRTGEDPSDCANMEWLWSRLDLAHQVGVRCVGERYLGFVKLIARALKPDCWGKVKQCAYGKLLQALDLDQRTGRERLLDDSMSFLSLNYDIALDYSLSHFAETVWQQEPRRGRWAHALRYWIGRPYEQLGCKQLPKLLKLHGSLNWGVCEDPECGSGASMNQEFDKLPEALFALHCDYHGEDKSRELIPLIVPPSWLKAPHGHNLRRVWGRAQFEVKKARLLIVVGHSLPPTDIYLKHFLGLAVGRHEGKPLKYFVVNRCSAHAERYACFLRKLGCEPQTENGWVEGDFGDRVGAIAEAVAEVLAD